MIYGLYLSGQGALAQSARHEVTANNLANVNTVGFKRDQAILQEYPPETDIWPAGRRLAGPFLTKIGGGCHLAATKSSMTEGPYVTTGRSLDLALRGDGQADSFFVVRQGQKMVYTRAGNFCLNGVGNLVTADGTGYIQGDAGDLRLTTTDVNVDSSGAIRDAVTGEEIGRMRIVRFESTEGLTKAGGTTFTGGEEPSEESPAAVEQGTLEMASVNAVREMVEMIEGLRAYEANMQLLKMQDDTLGRTVNEVGRVRRA